MTVSNVRVVVVVVVRIRDQQFGSFTLSVSGQRYDDGSNIVPDYLSDFSIHKNRVTAHFGATLCYEICIVRDIASDADVKCKRALGTKN